MFTVGISAYNEARNIGQLVEFLLKEDLPEILIYNDGSTDRTREILNSYHASNLRVYHSPRNQGFSAGFNWIVNHANHNIIVNLDADTLPEKEAIWKLVKPLLESPQIGAVCGTHIIGPRSSRSMIDRLNDRIYSAKYNLDCYNDRIGEFTHLNGLLLAFKRSCLSGDITQKTNLDVFLGYVIAQNGFTVRFIPEARSLFYPPSTLRDYLHSRDRVIMGHYVLAFDFKIKNYLFHEVPFPRYVLGLLQAVPFSLPNLISLMFGVLVDGFYRLRWYSRVKRNPHTYNRSTWRYLASTKRLVLHAQKRH